MARYIDTDKIIPTFTKWVDDVKSEYPDAYACAYVFTMKKIVEMLEKAETADVQPVVHGHWIETPYVEYGETIFKCSRCKSEYTVEEGDIDWDYCPNCGARMDGDTE